MPRRELEEEVTTPPRTAGLSTPSRRVAGRAEQLGIKLHQPVRRATSRGGCDLCGEALDSEVHAGELHEAEGGQELERIAMTNPLFQRHKDGTLCSGLGECKRPHLGQPEES